MAMDGMATAMAMRMAVGTTPKKGRCDQNGGCVYLADNGWYYDYMKQPDDH